MTHRSETEALRARLEEKGRELAAVRAELDAAGQLLWEARHERELIARRAERPSLVPWLVGGAVTTIGLVAVASLVGALAARAAPETPRRSPPSPSAAPAFPPRAPAPAAADSSGEAVHVALSARVIRASGATSLAEGDSCVVAVDVGSSLEARAVEVRCGDVVALARPLSGADLVEIAASPTDDGHTRYALSLTSAPARAVRAEIRSAERTGRITRDGDAAFEVSLEVAPTSGPMARGRAAALDDVGASVLSAR